MSTRFNPGQGLIIITARLWGPTGDTYARLGLDTGASTTLINEAACEARGMPRPAFVSEMGTFVVRFTKPVSAPERSPKLAREERYERALTYVREKGSITRAQYLELFRLSGAQTGRDLTDLLERGLLVRLGLGRTTRYALPGEG